MIVCLKKTLTTAVPEMTLQQRRANFMHPVSSWPFFILLAVWLVLSGKFDVFHVSLGIVSCLLVAYFSYDLLFSGPAVCSMTLVWLRFILYIPWLCYQIFLANLRILYLVFHPGGWK